MTPHLLSLCLCVSLLLGFLPELVEMISDTWKTIRPSAGLFICPFFVGETQ